MAAEPTIFLPMSPATTMTAATENSYIVADCKGTKPYSEIHCSLGYTSITKYSEEEMKKREGEAAKLPQADLQKFRNQCTQLTDTEVRQKLSEHSSTWPKERLNALSDFYGKMKDACARKDDGGIRRFMSLLGSDECSIKTQIYELDFQKVGPTKWLSNPGPQGLCNVVTVNILEQDPVRTGSWTLTEQRVSVGSSSGVCSKIKESKEVFSSSVPSTALMNCRTLSYGM